MSVKTIDEFYLMLLNDAELKKEFDQIKQQYVKGELTPENAVEFLEKGMVPLAKKRGLNFTVDDLMDYEVKRRSEIVKRLALSDDDLFNVGGGCMSRDERAVLCIKSLLMDF